MPYTFLDNLAEYVIVTRMNANGTSQAYRLQPFLLPMGDDPDRAKNPWDSVSLEDGIDDVRASHPNRLFICQIVISDALGKTAVHSAHRKNIVLRFDERKESEVSPLSPFEAPVKRHRFEQGLHLAGGILEGEFLGSKNLDRKSTRLNSSH